MIFIVAPKRNKERQINVTPEKKQKQLLQKQSLHPKDQKKEREKERNIFETLN